MTMFREGGDNPPVSIRRVLAFIFAIVGLALGAFAIFKGADWRVVAAVSGIPISACIILLLFTTWTDVAEVANVFKKG